MEQPKGFRIPALCKNCGAFFLSSVQCSLEDVRYGFRFTMPCFNCGERATSNADLVLLAINLFDELKNFRKEELEELQAQISLVKSYKKSDIAGWSIKKKSDSRTIAAVKRFLPKDYKQLIKLLGLASTIIMVLVKLKESDYPLVNVDSTIINNVFEQNLGTKYNGKVLNMRVTDEAKIKNNKPIIDIVPNKKNNEFKIIVIPVDKNQSLNAKCPCGSGKIFKRCHGLGE